jgi:ribose transport system permease protein
VNGDLLPDTAAPAAAPPTDPTTPRGGLRAVATRALQLRNLSLVGVLVLLFVVGTVSSANFLTRSNMINILTLAAVIGVVTVGATFVIIGGGIDLSVGAIVAVSTVWATTAQTQSYGVFVMMLTAVVVGIVAGILNGALIAYGRLVPFILTLATMAGGYGLAEQLSDRKSQFITVTSFTDIAQQRPLGIPLLVYIFAVVVAVGWFVLNRTVFGRRTFAVGGNPEAARLAGLDVRRHTLALYAVSGLCCGIRADQHRGVNAGPGLRTRLDRGRRHRRHAAGRRARLADRLGARRTRLHHHHEPVHPQQLVDAAPAHRQGSDHRRRRAAPAAWHPYRLTAPTRAHLQGRPAHDYRSHPGSNGNRPTKAAVRRGRARGRHADGGLHR